MFGWFKNTPPAPEPVPEPPARGGSLFTTHDDLTSYAKPNWSVHDRLKEFRDVRPARAPLVSADGSVTAMDSTDEGGDYSSAKGYLRSQPTISDALAMWYSAQSFIGHQLAALIAQQWLVMKACSMPARDAIRNGFEITTIDGDVISDEILKKMKRADKRFALKRNLVEYVRAGRVFGVRICIFKIDFGSVEADKEAYGAPFNIDGVKPGSYKGMIQVDPYWCSPELDADAASQPDTMHFYEPTYWQINGRRYHRSHLMIFRNGDLADILKPAYQYGGVPVPQLIMERVYGAERTANEAPLLALTKRTNVYKTDLSKFILNFDKGVAKLKQWSELWSNTGHRVIGDGDEVTQIDTSLADLDSVIMTQYQLVAAAANVPATKLLGTAPKGFNATGEFDESSYHEELESLQEHELTPFVERHHLLVLKSEIAEGAGIITTVSWNSLDTPTAKEKAEIDKLEAETDNALVQAGALDGVDVREALARAKDGRHNAIDANKIVEPPEPAPVALANV